MNNLHIKLNNLKEYIKSLESVAVAFSGGVDSTFLLKVAYEVLGENVISVTAKSSTYPEREFLEASAFAKNIGVKHIVCVSEELEIEGFAQNPVNRCYLCKNELFTKIEELKKSENFKYIVEGSNLDDESDYRPGHIAITEHGIKSPLRYAKLTKDEIRLLSKEMGLPTWNKQSFACLSSRFPYGETITEKKLSMVDKAEQLLLDLKFTQVRVRHHGEIARIEISEDDFSKVLDNETRKLICNKLKEYGFTYVSLDMQGYRTGSMNETI